MTFFVDWLNVYQEFKGSAYCDFFGGKVIKVKGNCISTKLERDEENGLLIGNFDVIEYNVSSFFEFEGSYDTTIMIRMLNNKLEMRGNPSSFMRLDNVFGVTLDRGIEIFNKILKEIGLPLFTEGEYIQRWNDEKNEFDEIYTGAIITRVDMCKNLSVGMGKVDDFMKWLLSQKLYRSNDGVFLAQQYDYKTIYLSSSKYWMNVKCYDKSYAIETLFMNKYEKKIKKELGNTNKVERNKNLKELSECRDYLEDLSIWCAEVGVARLEYSFKSRFLNDNKDLKYYRKRYTNRDLINLCNQEFDKLRGKMIKIENDGMDKLTNAELGVFQYWKTHGRVIENGRLSRAQFYRVRKSILEKIGVDISVPYNVVELTKYQRPDFFRVKELEEYDAPNFYRHAL